MKGPGMLRMEGEAEPRDGCDYLNSSFFALKKKMEREGEMLQGKQVWKVVTACLSIWKTVMS